MSFQHISESIPELLRQSTRLVRIGQESERARLLPHFAAIFQAYDLAVADSKAIPSSLMMAIESARQEIGKLSTPQTRAAQKFEYQERADGGNDMDTAGQRLRPGT